MEGIGEEQLCELALPDGELGERVVGGCPGDAGRRLKGLAEVHERLVDFSGFVEGVAGSVCGACALGSWIASMSA